MAAVEGPILALISKRLRALRKKYNRITMMEETISQGKTLNKDQEEILRSKPIVTALIEELVKLRLPSTPSTPSTPSSTNTNVKNNQKQKARKEMTEEENVTAKTDIEDCEVCNDSKDNTSPCNRSSEDVTPSPKSAGSRKSRRKQKSKKPQDFDVIVSPTSEHSGIYVLRRVKRVGHNPWQ